MGKWPQNVSINQGSKLPEILRKSDKFNTTRNSKNRVQQAKSGRDQHQDVELKNVKERATPKSKFSMDFKRHRKSNSLAFDLEKVLHDKKFLQGY